MLAMRSTVALAILSLLVSRSLAGTPISVRLEPIYVGDVDSFYVPVKLGSTKQRVLLEREDWGSYHDILHKSQCQSFVPVVPASRCEEWLGGLYEPTLSSTFQMRQNHTDTVFGNDTFEMGGVEVKDVGFRLHYVMPEINGTNKVYGGRASFGYSNTSDIWEKMRRSSANLTSRSVGCFAGSHIKPLLASPWSTTDVGQYNGWLTFGGYSKQLMRGPVLASAMHKAKNGATYSSPHFLVTKLVYADPRSRWQNTTIWDSQPGFQMEVGTIYDELDLPRSIRDRLETLTGAEVLYSQSSRTDSPNNIYSLPPDALIGDLIATIRILPDTAAVEAGKSIFPVANRSALDLSPREIEITIPASNLRLHNEPSFTLNVSAPANYSGAKLAVRALDSSASTGRYLWGRAFAQSVYTVADYDRGVFYLAQARLANVSEGLVVESLQRPFEESWYGAGGEAGGPPGGRDENVGAIVGGVVGGVAAVVLIAVAVWFWQKKKRTKTAGEEEVPRQQRVEEYVPITGRAEMDALGVDVVRNELDGAARRERVHELPGT